MSIVCTCPLGVSLAIHQIAHHVQSRRSRMVPRLRLCQRPPRACTAGGSHRQVHEHTHQSGGARHIWTLLGRILWLLTHTNRFWFHFFEIYLCATEPEASFVTLVQKLLEAPIVGRQPLTLKFGSDYGVDNLGAQGCLSTEKVFGSHLPTKRFEYEAL